MAFAVTARFDFEDNKGKNSFTKVRIPTGLAISDMLEFAQGMAQLMANLSAGRVTRAGICIGLDLSTATIKPTIINTSAEVEEKGFFQFRSALDPRFKVKMKIPALDETKVVSGSGDLDQTDGEIAAFVTAMEDGIAVTSATIQPTTGRANDIDALDFAKELFRGT